jgi:hypothetical protein
MHKESETPSSHLAIEAVTEVGGHADDVNK